MAAALTILAAVLFVAVLIVGAAVIGYRAGRQEALEELRDDLEGFIDDLAAIDAPRPAFAAKLEQQLGARLALSRAAGATDSAEVS